MNLKKVALISGGSKGLGEAIVRHLLMNNYCVATFSRHQTMFIQEISEKYPQNFYWKELNATDFLGLKNFVHEVIQQYDGIDVLINNVGITAEGIITTISPQTISSLLEINLKSAIQLTQVCVKNMLVNKSGIILNISSVVGLGGYTGQSVYSATKAGIDGFMRSLARELGPRGIRVNSIAPGYLETEMTAHLSKKQLAQIIKRTPLGRLGKIEDIVGIVDFMLSPATKFITGQTIVVDGGMTC